MEEARADVNKSCGEPEPKYVAVYNNLLKLEGFNRFAHSAELNSLIGGLIGEVVFPHPTKMGRIVFPQNTANSTPPHQDYVHIQCATETYTCWMPLGDCPRELGGLAIQAGSHAAGMFDYLVARGPGLIGVDPAQLTKEWLSTDYQAGDALIFHSLTVHKALPNLTEDRMRFSVDYRYQAASQLIVDATLLPHLGQISWDDIYSDWKSSNLKYYWLDAAPKLIEPD